MREQKERDEIMGLLPLDADILPASDDRVFKLILTSPDSKPVLMDLISSIINRPVVDVVVRNNEIPPGDTSEKAERLDVNCSIDDGSQVDLEMQASRIEEDSDGQHANLKGKSVYYLCDLHSSQSSKGVRRYDRLAKTYQVTFCSYTVRHNSKDFVQPYSMRHDEDGELLTDAVRAIFVELSKLDGVLKKAVSDMTDLEKWAVFFRYASVSNQREAVNRVIESKEVLKMAGDLLMSISKDERERAVFRSRRMYQTDYESNIATAEDRGMARGMVKGIAKGRVEGRAEGRAEGRVEGRAEGRVEGRAEGKVEGRAEGKVEGEANKALAIAKNLLGIKLPVDQIVVATGLTRAEVEGLRNAD